jgi:glycogen debranching enzyme
MEERRARAVEVLAANRREGYTVPSAALYPFQWCWDSAFVAVGLVHEDAAAARRELTTLLSAAWENGMVPQIVFWTDAGGYFPGPAEWDAAAAVADLGVDTPASAGERVATSAITQPPMVVPAVRRVYEATGDDDFLERVRPACEAYLEWWFRERSPDGRLVYSRHPWETGMDDSPAWREPLAAFDPGAVTADLDYAREDRTSPALADQRPADWDYDRYVALVRQGRALGWDEASLREACPFRVEDALTNALLVRACEDLGALSAAAGDDDAAARWRAQAATSREGMRDRLWDEELGLFVSYDRVGERPLRTASVAGLVPTYADVPTNEQFARLRRTVRERFFAHRYACPSYVGPDADPDRYWRGPVWVNTNWLVLSGLRRYGATDLADRVERDTRRLVAETGFYEYFNPETGAGRGSEDFSWSAALALDLLAERGSAEPPP